MNKFLKSYLKFNTHHFSHFKNAINFANKNKIYTFRYKFVQSGFIGMDPSYYSYLELANQKMCIFIISHIDTHERLTMVFDGNFGYIRGKFKEIFSYINEEELLELQLDSETSNEIQKFLKIDYQSIFDEFILETI